MSRGRVASSGGGQCDAAALEELSVLATRHGIATCHDDGLGRACTVPTETLLAVLTSLGTVIDRPSEARACLDELDELSSHEVLAPVIATSIDRPGSVRISESAAERVGGRWVTLELESGMTYRARGSELVLPSSDGAAAPELSLERLCRASGAVPGEPCLAIGQTAVPVKDDDPTGLSAGYHRLFVEGIDGAEALVIAAPDVAPLPRQRWWGVTAPVYALRGTDDHGVGSYRDLARLTELVASLGGDVVGTLPLFAIAAAAPLTRDAALDPSPYLPVSRLALNEAYLDPSDLPGMELAEESVIDGLRPWRSRLPDSERADRGTASPVRVDYAAVMAVKRPVLEHLARFVVEASPVHRSQLVAFGLARPELVAYACFRAEAERRATPWRHWPQSAAAACAATAIAGAGAAGAWSLDHAESRPLEVAERTRQVEAVLSDPVARYHLYAQWATDTQLRSARGAPGAGETTALGRSRAGLYLDLPVGTHPDGFDTFGAPEDYAVGSSGGSPPDGFFSDGQTWGFPPLHPERLRANRYRSYIAGLRAALRYSDAVRIDHVMGLRRMYVIPDGASATDGAYVSYRSDELQAIVRLEASRAGALVIGEDLGTVPPSLREEMANAHLLRSFVFQFSSSRDDPLPEPPELSLASLSTHDVAPFAAHFTDPSPQRQRWREAVCEALGCSTAAATIPRSIPDPARAGVQGARDELRQVLDRLLRYLAASPAAVVVADLADLLLELEPHNRPGTGPSAGNFSRRFDVDVDALFSDRPFVDSLLAMKRTMPCL